LQLIQEQKTIFSKEDVTDAMIRQVKNESSIPFKKTSFKPNAIIYDLTMTSAEVALLPMM